MPLGQDATAGASPLRDRKNIKWQYQMPCSLSVLEPPLIVEALARQLDSENSAPRETREQFMALDVANPIRDVIELYRVGELLLKLVELSCDVVEWHVGATRKTKSPAIADGAFKHVS